MRNPEDDGARRPLLDPRQGDIEDDVSSPQKRSIWALAGSLLAEISLPKLVVSSIALVGLPGLLVGALPLVGSAWLSTLSGSARTALEMSPIALVLLVLAVGWIVGRPALRLAEEGFWALNAIAVQPGYALAREGLRHLAEPLRTRVGPARRETVDAALAAAGGVLASLVGLAVAWAAWPHIRWHASLGELASPLSLVIPALANAAFLVSTALAIASVGWGFADAVMDQPRDLDGFDTPDPALPVWRVAHLSDLHVVGERHGWRIESGRAGPSGNDRLGEALARLDAVHAADPLDLIVVTGDMTDAGRNAEWVEFGRALARHPALAGLVLMLPGNHDVNVVDRANPARLDLPTSPLKRLRQVRVLAALSAFQGGRVRVMTASREKLGDDLATHLDRQQTRVRAFADTGRFRLLAPLGQLWADCFPMVRLPPAEGGLGVILLNSNAETHFSFTNALGLVSTEQIEAIDTVLAAFPRGRFLIALHHHLVEYPRPAKAFSERIGTALINGTWVVRRLKRHGRRIVVLHGHRHVDWKGACGPLRIVSAPSPVMGAPDGGVTSFHVLRFQPGPDGRLALLRPQTVWLGAAKPTEPPP